MCPMRRMLTVGVVPVWIPATADAQTPSTLSGPVDFTVITAVIAGR
jgi:hypothetical protein